MQPLNGLKVLDFSTLLPGPLATLLLAESGAEVIKIERPGQGDEMRSYMPGFGQDSANFALLNRGKRSVTLDLKKREDLAQVYSLVEWADVLVEQFRPGVMERLGLGYEVLSQRNPRLIYCSVSGYGGTGPRAKSAGHDLNYIAETGMLGLSAGEDGAPILPPALIADIAGGAYPAVMNILLALRERDQSGCGRHLDISMADGLFTFMYWALANMEASGAWPQAGGELVTGGSPRYQIYRTADDRFIAAAPLEQKFWNNFCQLIALPERYRDDSGQEPSVTRAVAERIRAHSAAHWLEVFSGQDVCCSLVSTLEEALADPQFQHRGLFLRKVGSGSEVMGALPVPVDPGFRDSVGTAAYPHLGEANGAFRGNE